MNYVFLKTAPDDFLIDIIKNSINLKKDAYEQLINRRIDPDKKWTNLSEAKKHWDKYIKKTK